MPQKTPQEKYAEAFKALLKAKEEVMQDSNNPFNLNLPTHSKLPEETFITDAELDELIETIGEAAEDNNRFARLWNIGTDVVVKGKSLLLNPAGLTLNTKMNLKLRQNQPKNRSSSVS